ncbi:MAG: alanine--glyoxylate aminotransferase family protein [Alphaproteobacteria bacterium]|nr:alanine--glyoxylate aminotransferase family protein [Alphaproteobacteria bacterium]
MKKLLLFTPGPVNVAKNVKAAICREDICHREVEFDNLLESIENKLLRLYEIKTISNYRAVVITGSGTAANETMLSSIVGDKNILILSNGEFGERLYKMSKIHNKNTFLLDFSWGKTLNLEKIEAYLQAHDIDIVAMVHHETSSGMLNPLEKVGALSKENGAMLIVDCVSSTGAEVIDMEKCGISFCSSSSSKAVCSYPGLSFVVGRIDEFEKLKDMPVKSTYLNLYNFYNFIKEYSQTPNTPAVPLFFALEQTLNNILDKGVANHHDSLRARAQFLRQGMLKLGLKFLIDEKDMCCVLTTVKVPFHINVTSFRQRLREKSIIIYEGKGCFKNKVFQVGNIGELSSDNLQFFLKSLEEVLRSFDPINVGNIRSINASYPVLIPSNDEVLDKAQDTA